MAGLEDAIKALTEATVEHTSVMREAMKQADKLRGGSGKAANGDAEDKPTRTARGGGKAKEEEEKSAVAEAVEVAQAWIQQIVIEADNDGDVIESEENTANQRKRSNRVTFIKKCCTKLGADKVSEIANDADAKKFMKWIEQKKGGTDPFAPADDV